ncbi:3-hydroxyacyl-CoA dehydrogenase [Auritidibacter sp. NML130574]|uniref:3-hydroxyacyl-CoA dehydrogenase NAD-binding domain-containing protein n=1 Tax=Auritidibacter sp. NML130574 TaxID=2170745 RepID=UPI000D72ED0B|nr:3-hydroxyacyl-CoA dehydrogenase NAD-binding domain-containing protein [Auritidibacter sp. NML130574]AXR74308.1 3-hydroxyacyl-CoA dehydrogenase [Auritidibacter sp. NML130574]
MTTENYTGYQWDQDADGIVTITMDDPNASVNTMNDHFVQAFSATVDRLEAEEITGVVITSAKKTWFAGGNLEQLREMTPENTDAQVAELSHIKSLLRRLEQLGKPVVAAMHGAALGGGLEIALASHYRLAASDNPKARYGVPEVTLGLLPGGGGVTRLVRMLGIQDALQKVVIPGTQFKAEDAHALGLIDELVPTEKLHEAAVAWIKNNPEPVQPWDQEGFKIPGGDPKSPKVASQLPALPALLRRQLKGANFPAPRAAMAAAVEGASVDIDTALAIETRYFIHLTHSQVAKNMIQAFFFDMQHIKSGGSRPDGIAPREIKKLGVLGAGLMGAGIAYVSAKAGLDVVLKDVSLEAAEKGKDYARKLEAKALQRGKTTEEKSQALLDRITPTGEASDFEGVDFVIEAVFESVELKHQVFQEIQDIVTPDALLGSNTSSLPITSLAAGVDRQEDFIGIHFFSPVDKMPLVEIICGEKTSDEALARAFDYVAAIRKTPIVVTDSRGFFTSRVIDKYMREALAAVGEGVEPATVEHAAMQAGYPSGPLSLLDDLTLTLPLKIRSEAEEADRAAGIDTPHHPSQDVLRWMVEEADRPSRKSGRGFYDYDENGKRQLLWPGLREHFKSGTSVPELIDLQERMLFAEALDTIACLEEGVLTSVPDANIGSILGIGFPAWTGGVLQYVNQYAGGLQGFVDRARELAEKYGDHFLPSDGLIAKAKAGEKYE